MSSRKSEYVLMHRCTCPHAQVHMSSCKRCMCPHAKVYVSSFRYLCILMHMRICVPVCARLHASMDNVYTRDLLALIGWFAVKQIQQHLSEPGMKDKNLSLISGQQNQDVHSLSTYVYRHHTSRASLLVTSRLSARQ